MDLVTIHMLVTGPAVHGALTGSTHDCPTDCPDDGAYWTTGYGADDAARDRSSRG